MGQTWEIFLAKKRHSLRAIAGKAAAIPATWFDYCIAQVGSESCGTFGPDATVLATVDAYGFPGHGGLCPDLCGFPKLHI